MITPLSDPQQEREEAGELPTSSHPSCDFHLGHSPGGTLQLLGPLSLRAGREGLLAIPYSLSPR